MTPEILARVEHALTEDIGTGRYHDEQHRSSGNSCCHTNRRADSGVIADNVAVKFSCDRFHSTVQSVYAHEANHVTENPAFTTNDGA